LANLRDKGSLLLSTGSAGIVKASKINGLKITGIGFSDTVLVSENPIHIPVTQSIGIISVQARGILPRPEEQSRTCGCQSGSVEDQPQCPGL
jgi:hypothetical protein